MKAVCVIPHYNHFATVLTVAAGACRHLADVLVVDDGSTGIPEEFSARLAALGVKLIRHDRNLGKGAALLTAARELSADGVTHMIVIDADGQHDPEALPRFVAAAEAHPDAVIVGCRKADIIVGPLAIVIADSMFGEITPAMALAVAQSNAKRILIPFNHCDNIVVGMVENGAILHKGERVVPAREVSNSRSFSSNLYVESMYMSGGADAEGLAAAMAAAQKRTMSGYGS